MRRPPTSAYEEINELIADYERKIEAQENILTRWQNGTQECSARMVARATDKIFAYENKIAELLADLGGAQ